MVTTQSPSPSVSSSDEKASLAGAGAGGSAAEDAPQLPHHGGVVNLVIRSIQEPGANDIVVVAMNVSFILLIITLFGLAVLTSWNLSVLGLIAITLVLWCAMNAFIYQLNTVQANPENAPPNDPLLAGADDADDETRKDR